MEYPHHKSPAAHTRTLVASPSLFGLVLFGLMLSGLAHAQGSANNDDSQEQSTNSNASSSESSDSPLLQYHGELLDEENKPISGVFPLKFDLHTSETSKTPVWTETQFVSVHLGEYQVTLGADEELPENLIGKDAFIAVSIESVGEIVRHEFTVEPNRATGPGAPPVEQLEQLRFADVADRALLAERARTAETCERIGGVDADKLKKIDTLERQIQQLKAKVEQLSGQSNAGDGTTIGNRTITLEQAGGDGGKNYRYTCPTNHVAIGMTGTHGNLVDSAALICAPLE